MKWLCMDWNQVCRRHHTVFCKVLLLSIGTWRRERAGDRDRERARRKRVERTVRLYSDFLEFNRECLLHYHSNAFFKCLWKKTVFYLSIFKNVPYWIVLGVMLSFRNLSYMLIIIKVEKCYFKVYSFCHFALPQFSNVFFLETISSDLWTISFLFTSDWNFLLIWANCKCFGTCVQTVSTIVCSLHSN